MHLKIVYSCEIRISFLPFLRDLMKDLLLPNFWVQVLILPVAEMINYDKLFPSFLSGKVYFVTWLLLKCNCRHYLLPEKNLNQDRVPFCKRIHSSVATLLKAGTTIWNAMSYIILEVRLDMHRSFLISTFMKPEGKNRQITFA